MKLYLLKYADAGYDQFDEAVVCANSREEAVSIHPWEDDISKVHQRWDGLKSSTWGAKEEIECILIGTALPAQPIGCITNSYNAS